MLIITKNTEKIFLDVLFECKRNGATHRCLYFNPAGFEMPRAEWFPVLVRAFEKIESSIEPAHMYVFHDEDIMVLLHGIPHKTLERILHKISEILQLPEGKSPCSIFDTQADYTHLRSLCEKKYTALNAVQRKAGHTQEKVSRKEALEDTFIHLDPELVLTFSVRKHTHKRPEILIVEDDSLSRTLVKNSLDRRFDPLFVQNGKTAIEFFAETAPDIVFLDIGLPDASGHEVLDYMLQIDPEAYIIMLSGRRDETNVLSALENGAKGFITKPFARKTLYQYIERSPFFEHAEYYG
ncbi:MAG: response regulator [Alphaproteobacteria bacterium]